MFHRRGMKTGLDTMRCAVTMATLALLLGACDSALDPATEGGQARYGDPELLLWGEAWQAGAAGDPFPEHRPGQVSCNRAAHRTEYGALELDTGLCNYFVLSTPTLQDVLPGDRISVRAFHEDLAALEPAVAHLAVAIDGHVVWDQEVSIPSAPTPYDVDVIADFEAPAGSPAVLHLHNHGVNTYRVIDVRVTPRL